MVRHQAVGEHGDIGFGATIRDPIAVSGVREKSLHPSRATLGDVMGKTGNDDAGRSGHARTIDERKRTAKLKVRCEDANDLENWWLSRIFAFFREMAEMRFQWDRPYYVESSKFSARLWADATPFEKGAEATVRSFRL